MGQQLEFELLPPAPITPKQNKDAVRRGSLEHPPAQILPRPGARAATGMLWAAGASRSPSCLLRPVPVICRLLRERHLCNFVVVARVAVQQRSHMAVQGNQSGGRIKVQSQTEQANTPSANSPSYSKGLVSNRKIIPNMTSRNVSWMQECADGAPFWASLFPGMLSVHHSGLTKPSNPILLIKTC